MTAERRREIGFGLGLLLIVGLAFAALETAARWYVSAVRDRNVDWRAMRAAAGTETQADAPMRFEPNARFAGIAFNQRGFRGPQLATHAPPRTLRIAFLGDSKTFSADQAEALTLPAQTVARLRRARPDCRFDYVNMSGPGYTLPYLATLWRAEAPDLRPGLAVLLAGGPIELASAAAPARATTAPATKRLVDRSAFLTLLARELLLVAPAAALDRRDLPPAAIAAAHARLAADLAAATRGTPVLAIGYRSRLRPDQDARQRRFASRELRQSLPGLPVDAALALSEATVRAGAATAARAGWRFVDPLRSIPGDNAHFIDRTHLSARGLARLADALATDIAPRVNVDCRLR